MKKHRTILSILTGYSEDEKSASEAMVLKLFEIIGDLLKTRKGINLSGKIHSPDRDGRYRLYVSLFCCTQNPEEAASRFEDFRTTLRLFLFSKLPALCLFEIFLEEPIEYI